MIKKLLSEIIARDPEIIFFGIDSSEHFIGESSFSEAINKLNASIKKANIKLRNQVINVNQIGKTAWFSEIWDG
jgi:hypothetical protein